jgi:hypothetical protein
MNQPDLARLQGLAALKLDPGYQEAQQLLEQIPAVDPAARKTP